jgi:hypothetical protein
MISIFVLLYYADEQDRAEESEGGVPYSRAWGPVVYNFSMENIVAVFQLQSVYLGHQIPTYNKICQHCEVKNSTRLISRANA